MIVGATHKVTARFTEQLALSLRQPMRAARTVKAGVNPGAAAVLFPGLRRSIQLLLHAKTLPSKTVFETHASRSLLRFHIAPPRMPIKVDQGPSSGLRKPTPTAICLAPDKPVLGFIPKKVYKMSCRVPSSPKNTNAFGGYLSMLGSDQVSAKRLSPRSCPGRNLSSPSTSGANVGST